MQKHDWQKLVDKIQPSEKILLTTHHNPDGDGLGSEAALYHCLARIGKSPLILNSSPLPMEYTFLNEDGIFNTYRSEAEIGELLKFDLVIILDAGGTERLGHFGPVLKNMNLPMVCIDHHPFNNFPDGNISVIDVEASATAALVFEFIRYFVPQTLDLKIATALYTGIMTDTGSFRFENTTADTLRSAAELLQYGVRPDLIYRNVYENYRPERMRLLGIILQNVQYEFENRLAWFYITHTQIKAAGAILDEVDGFTDFVRSIRGVEIAVMFLQVRGKRTRMNFRSKGHYTVNDIARQFGGGGHPYAAGLILDKNLDECIQTVLPAVREKFSSEGES